LRLLGRDGEQRFGRAVQLDLDGTAIRHLDVQAHGSAGLGGRGVGLGTPEADAARRSEESGAGGGGMFHPLLQDAQVAPPDVLAEEGGGKTVGGPVSRRRLIVSARERDRVGHDRGSPGRDEDIVQQAPFESPRKIERLVRRLARVAVVREIAQAQKHAGAPLQGTFEEAAQVGQGQDRPLPARRARLGGRGAGR
jgi:hypothetical protein